MKPNILGAAMREMLMRAYLQIQVDDDQDALTLDYAAKVSTMPDAELIERLSDYSSEGREVASKVLQQWRKQSQPANEPQDDDTEARTTVAAVLLVDYKFDGQDTEASLAEGLQKELQDAIDMGDILTAANSAEVEQYSLTVY